VFSVSVLRHPFSVLAICGISVLISHQASAYRPFDGTDADVAKPGMMEIELQPAGVLWQNSQKTLVAPATVINVGLWPGWEAVFEGRGQFPLGSDERTSLVGAGAFLKGILRPGSLQEKSGPSIATEFGILLPGVNAESGFGASLAGIVSHRWDWGTAHLNIGTAITRENRADLFVGTILEGPSKWKVRPVAEIFYEEEFGQTKTVSGLIGAIWQIKEDLSLDVGIRHAITNGHAVDEVRIGMTFGFALRPITPLHRN
jgi:hypothetical protein